jgi:hypothetical protein
LSLRPRSGEQVPSLTVQIARASNPGGTTAMWVRDRLDWLWHDEDFAGWYPRDGRPGLSPAQLATVCVLQFLLGLSDRQAAEAVRCPSSLALGGALACLAIFSRTEMLLALLVGLFLLITLSVVIQVSSFKMTGKRVFKMAPLQHHFELKGWSEVLVVVRFWTIQGVCVIVGLGLFYAGWAAG